MEFIYRAGKSFTEENNCTTDENELLIKSLENDNI